jgi:hypothetical protein
MRQIALLIGTALLATSTLFAQTIPNPDVPIEPQEEGPIKVMNEPPRRSDEPQAPPSWKDRLRLGGSFGLSLGTFTNIEVSPMAGLQLTNKLTVGAGPVYQYYRWSGFGGPASSQSVYGGRIFSFLNVLENINLNVEYESLNRQYADFTNRRNNRIWLNSFLVGGSYSTPLGGRFVRSANIMILYNLRYNSLVNPSDPTQNLYPNGSPLVFRVTFF